MSTRPILPIPLHVVVRSITCSSVRKTRTSPLPRVTGEPNRVVTILEQTTDRSTTAYQPLKSTASESLLILYPNDENQIGSYPKVDKDSTVTEVPHYDRDEDQILILSRSKNHSHSPRPPTRYVRPTNIPYAYGATSVNSPGWCTYNRIICHHCYTPREISPECTIPLDKIPNVVTNYEMLTDDEKYPVSYINYEFANQFIPGSPERQLANEVKNAPSKKGARDFQNPCC